MEATFYPVVTVENVDELDMVRSYCDEYKIDIQFLDEDLNKFPAQILLYIDEHDFKLFLESID